MYDGDGKKKLFVDFEQTSFCENGSLRPWFSCHDDAVIDFDDRSYYQKDVFEEGSYEDEIFAALGDSEKGETIGRIHMPKSLEDIQKIDKAKYNVYNTIIKPGTYRSIKNGIVSFIDGNFVFGEKQLSRIFSSPIIKLLEWAAKEGFSYERIFNAARLGISYNEIKELLETEEL